MRQLPYSRRRWHDRQIGPNLDYAFYASRRDGLGESTFVQVVRGQIAYPIAHTSTGAPGMPKNLVTGHQADDIASYVGRVAGDRASMNGKAAGLAAPDDHHAPGGRWLDHRRRRGRQGRVHLGRLRRGCHTLADAGSTGNVGPNLDEAKPDEALVKERVTNGKAPMPSFKGQLSDQQIADVAAYVASVAGK